MMDDGLTESGLDAAKAGARRSALEARAAAHAAGAGAARMAAGHALELIGGLRGVATVGVYLPVRSEIDSMPAALALAGLGYRLAVPVVVGPGLALEFRSWTAGAPTVAGAFGVPVPDGGAPAVPDVLLVPLLAFDAGGHRLGYGGGFYDRTIAALRAAGAVQALGFAYAAQQVPAVPVGALDVRLDAVVTEAGIRWPQLR